MNTELNKAKEKITSELESSLKVLDFFREAKMDEILTVSIILKTLNISERMSLNDYNIIQECIDSVDTGEE